MSTWIITAVDPDALEDGRGVVATMHGTTRGEALAVGCEAILDGWVDVTAEGPLGMVYPLVDVA